MKLYFKNLPKFWDQINGFVHEVKYGNSRKIGFQRPKLLDWGQDLMQKTGMMDDAQAKKLNKNLNDHQKLVDNNFESTMEHVLQKKGNISNMDDIKPPIKEVSNPLKNKWSLKTDD